MTSTYRKEFKMKLHFLIAVTLSHGKRQAGKLQCSVSTEFSGKFDCNYLANCFLNRFIILRTISLILLSITRLNSSISHSHFTRFSLNFLLLHFSQWADNQFDLWCTQKLKPKSIFLCPLQCLFNFNVFAETQSETETETRVHYQIEDWRDGRWEVGGGRLTFVGSANSSNRITAAMWKTNQTKSKWIKLWLLTFNAHTDLNPLSLLFQIQFVDRWVLCPNVTVVQKLS